LCEPVKSTSNTAVPEGPVAFRLHLAMDLAFADVIYL